MQNIIDYEKKLNSIIERDEDIGFGYRRILEKKEFIFASSKPLEFEYCLLGFGMDMIFIQNNWKPRKDLTHFKHKSFFTRNFSQVLGENGAILYKAKHFNTHPQLGFIKKYYSK